jgi:uncharacterized protein (DUF2141 family)
MRCAGLACTVAFLAGVWGGPAAASVLQVEATGFGDGSGQAWVAVFASRHSFPEQPRFTAPQPIAAGTARWDVPDLPSGDYAVLVWHDRDGDGVLDTGWGGPDEPYGYSNGVRGKRPKWEDARVALGPDPLPVPIRIEEP